MGSYPDVPTDELIQRWRETAEERGSMLEDSRRRRPDHNDRLGSQLDEISDELIDRGVKDW